MSMMRAEAKAFQPVGSAAEVDWDPAMKFGANRPRCDSGSTAVPSPSMTSMDLYADVASPWGSPYWGMNMGLLAPLPESDQFVLPDAHSKLAIGEDPAGDFTLTGLQDFASSVAGLIAHVNAEKAPPLPPFPDDAVSLSPPPGLDADTSPPGLEMDDETDDISEDAQSPASGPAPPPGLDEPEPQHQRQRLGNAVTVSELHAKLNSKAPRPTSGRTRAESRDDEDQQPLNTVGPLNLPDKCTTVMFRNIPNKYTQDMLTARLFKCGYKGEIDFVYLPIDFKNKCNVGYAFLNFRTGAACTQFAKEFHGARSWEKLPGFKSRKICEVSAARFQGCEENVARLQGSPVMVQLAQKPEWLPQLFDEDGEALDFPVPDTSSSAGTTERSRGNSNGGGGSGASPKGGSGNAAGKSVRAGRLNRRLK